MTVPRDTGGAHGAGAGPTWFPRGPREPGGPHVISGGPTRPSGGAHAIFRRPNAIFRWGLTGISRCGPRIFPVACAFPGAPTQWGPRGISPRGSTRFSRITATRRATRRAHGISVSAGACFRGSPAGPTGSPGAPTGGAWVISPAGPTRAYGAHASLGAHVIACPRISKPTLYISPYHVISVAASGRPTRILRWGSRGRAPAGPQCPGGNI